MLMHVTKQHTSTLPAELDEQLQACLRAPKSTVLYHLLSDGVRAALDGAELPPGRTRRNTGGAVAQVRWTQDEGEFAEWRRIVEERGSTLTAVLRWRVAAYVAAGGSTVEAAWDPKESLQPAC